MRILILGTTGMLGKDLILAFAGHDVTAFGSRDADLRDVRQILPAVERARPDWIILSAAYTDVDGCEANAERAFAVNRDGALEVAHAAIQTGSRLLFLSTDYVFDGEKRTPYEIDDARNPINVYGRSKAEAELGLLQLMPECCIVRTSWLFGLGGKCFPDTILRLARTQTELRVVDDQRGCPTFTSDLAHAIAELVRNQASGIVHVTNRGNCTWFEFARGILGLEASSSTVTPIKTTEFPRPARRPAYSVLSAASLRRYGIELREWGDALASYLQQRRV